MRFPGLHLPGSESRLSIFVAFVTIVCAAPALGKLRTLERTADIQVLSPSDAARQYPVRLKGIVTYYDPSLLDLFVQDSSGSIYVACQKPVAVPLQQGDSVEVTGITGPGEFAPVVENPQIRVLGPGVLPQPLKLTLEDLATGSYDSAWVEVHGTVLSAGVESQHVGLYITSGAEHVRVMIPNYAGEDLNRLPGAHITMRGVCGATFTKRRQLTGVVLRVQRMHDVVTSESARTVASELPLSHAAGLLQFAPGKSARERVRLRGVVTFQQLGRSVFIRDGEQGLMVETRQTTLLQPGDQVEAVGIAAAGEYNPILRYGTVQVLSRGPAPAPFRLTAEQALKGDHDGDLVEIEGDLLGWKSTQRADWLGLKSDGQIFEAEIDQTAGELAGLQLAESSHLRLTGIGLIEVGGAFNDPKSFRLLLRSGKDILVLQRPGWWTLSRAFGFLAFLGVGVLAALAWVLMLRRRVQAQTQQLRSNNLELSAALQVAEQSKQVAQEASKLKSEFLANMSHEIRTPMNAIIGMTALAQDTSSSEERNEYLGDAMHAATALLALLNDILDFSKIEAGRIELSSFPFSLRECLDGSTSTLAVEAERKGLQLVVLVEPDVPDMVVGDPLRLRQVMLNLVNNSVKFTNNGSIEVRANLYDRNETALTLHFSVCDTGMGIPRDKVDTIFEAFRQADGSITRRHGGTGLGLTICSRLVKLMGGSIWVESELGVGSTFHFTAMLGPATEDGPPSSGRQQESTAQVAG